MSGLETLNTENVTQVINLLGDLGATRVIVTDSEGRALYDSLAKANAAGKFVLFSEVALALEGNDIFYCAYRRGRWRAAPACRSSTMTAPSALSI